MATPITTPFALSGEKDTVPATDAAGAVNWTSGWTSRYSLDTPAPDRLTVDRKAMNYVDYVMSDAIREIQKQGVANWYPEHAPYAKNAQVFHGGRVWRSDIDDNYLEPSPITAGWRDVSVSNIPLASTDTPGAVLLASAANMIAGNPHVVPTAQTVTQFYNAPYRQVLLDADGGTVSGLPQYYRVQVDSDTPITITIDRLTASIGDSVTSCVMLDKREMTGAAPTLTITADGAGSIVLKPEGSDPLALSDTQGIAMLYITTMYVDGAQVVTCNLQEWESI